MKQTYSVLYSPSLKKPFDAFIKPSSISNSQKDSLLSIVTLPAQNSGIFKHSLFRDSLKGLWICPVKIAPFFTPLQTFRN